MNVHTLAAGKYPKPGRKPKHPVSVMRVNPVVWARALTIANGNGSRIQIVNPDTVIVWNHAGVRYGRKTNRARR